MMTLSFCCIHKFVMVVIKPCETSMPKQQLSCDDKMIGLGVSHGFMTAMNPFATTCDVSFHSISRSNEMQHIWGKIQFYYFWNRDCYRDVGFGNLTVPGEVLVKLFSNTILFFLQESVTATWFPPPSSVTGPQPPSTSTRQFAGQQGERHIIQPFIPRIQWLYMTEESAKQMTWHKEGKR